MGEEVVAPIIGVVVAVVGDLPASAAVRGSDRSEEPPIPTCYCLAVALCGQLNAMQDSGISEALCSHYSVPNEHCFPFCRHFLQQFLYGSGWGCHVS
ncbi:hypothetical protein BaRGS_00013629 [Batillaria attramentaria]|uniref:Secreted protein n=1 Tax=Batillaria attramentaria TaxID=370345 RepID=A0ABD0L7X5_9CAEN